MKKIVILITILIFITIPNSTVAASYSPVKSESDPNITNKDEQTGIESQSNIESNSKDDSILYENEPNKDTIHNEDENNEDQNDKQEPLNDEMDTKDTPEGDIINKNAQVEKSADNIKSDVKITEETEEDAMPKNTRITLFTKSVEKNISKLGRIDNSKVKIYKTIGVESSSFLAGSNYTDKVLYIKKQAQSNGQLYFLISTVASDSKGVIGWVNSKDIWAQDHVAVDHNNKTFYLKGSGWAYTNPWGAGKDAIYRDLTPFQFQTFRVNLTEKVGNAIWYRGYLQNGQKVWIQSYNVTTAKPLVTFNSISKLGRILNHDVSIYKNIGSNTNSFKAGTKYTDKIFYIKKQAKLSGQLFYLISTVASDSRGVIGWVNAKDIWAQDHVAVDHNNKTFYLKGSGWAYTNPWGAGKDAVYKDLSQFKYQSFKVNLTEKVGNAIWYRGLLENGQKVWIQAYNVVTPTYKATSKLGRISNQSVKIYKTLGEDSTALISGADYTDKVYYIKKEAHLNGQLFYLISTVASDSRGIIGWVRSQDIWAQNHVALDHNEKTFYLKGSGWAYTNPWGAGKDAIYKDLTSFKDQLFKVNLTEKVGDAVWYRGLLENGQKVWIQAYNVTEVVTRKTNYNYTLEEFVRLQANASPRTDNSRSNSYKQPVAYVSSEYIIRNGNTGIVNVSGSLNVRFEPNTKSRKVGTLTNGSKVNILDEVVDTNHNSNRKWYAISYNHGYPEGGKWQFPNYDDISYYVNPENFITNVNSREIFQFLVLSNSSGIKASDLAKELVGKGIFSQSGMADAFIIGARTHNVNEFYLVSHALLETGNGNSNLSNGVIEVGVIGNNKWITIQPSKNSNTKIYHTVELINGKYSINKLTSFNLSKASNISKVYNMFGIGANDGAADVLGAVTAYRNGWTNPQVAIIGGAKFIGERYVNHPTYKQNTLYKMRWNPDNPATHQYASDIGWAYKQTNNIYNYYQKYDYLPKVFDIPSFM